MENNNTTNPNEALDAEQMDSLMKTVVPQIEKGEAPAIVDALEELERDSAKSIKANPEPVRLPKAGDIDPTEINRDEMVKVGSEVLHEDVVVGQPDYNYVPTHEIKDEVPTDSQEPPKGLIIEKPKEPEFKERQGLSVDSQENISTYMKSMEEDVEDAREIRERMSDINPNLRPLDGGKNRNVEANAEAAEDTRSLEDIRQGTVGSDRAARAKEAVVIIDKIESKNVQFTEDERAKMERSDVIRVNEVKRVDMKSIRRRREKRSDVHRALKRRGNTMRSTNILLPASGYYAEMLGCAPYEVMTLQREDDPLTDNQIRWNLIYEKIKYSSIEFKTFEEFARSTAVADYETFVWGILRSTFEDIDKIAINCVNENCHDKDGNAYAYDHDYSVVGLLRPEELNDRLRESVTKVASTRTVTDAKKAHDEAPVNDVLAIELPDSGHIVEIGIATVDEFLNRTLDHLSDESLEPQYRQAAVMSTAIRAINILDDATGEYDTYEDKGEITEIIFKMSTNDLLLVAHYIEDHTSDVSFKYGFIDLECPRCLNKTEYQPMDVASILFYRNALSMNASIE